MEKKTYRLDNAANMIPATTTGMDTRIMRITCECEEEIDAAALQEASDRAALAFPQMNCCLRKGLFWYYLEEMETRITVQRETAPVMQNIYIPGRRNTLYRLLFYKNRIILEMFHVLADGTGAFRFLEYIVTEYLILKYHLDPETYRRKISGVSDQERDSFRQYYDKERVQKRNYIKELFSVRAYRLPNRRDRNMEQHLLEGAVAAGQMKKLAHSFGTTIGVLVTALWVGAFLKQMNRSDYRRPVVVSVPVNLRNYFSSESTRNFFGVIKVFYDPMCYDGTLESLIRPVEEAFQMQLESDAVEGMMNSYSALEHNLPARLVPLFLKDAGMAKVSQMMNRGVTTSVSNVGKLSLAEGLRGYVKNFGAAMSCKTTFMTVATYENTMLFGITSAYEEHPVACEFFRSLVENGISVCINSNDYEKDIQGGTEYAEM